jgi:hypothetical protein
MPYRDLRDEMERIPAIAVFIAAVAVLAVVLCALAWRL